MKREDFQDHMFAMIPAGGGGTRLWPKSTNKTPKQFLKLFGKKTLTEITTERIARFIPWDRIYVVTTTDAYGKEIKRLVPKIPKENIVVEPTRRDSAPAHALGAALIYKRDPDAVIINSGVDHLIKTEKSYEDMMLSAAKVAYKGDWLVAVGIIPTYPHTGMGHLKRGKRLDRSLSHNVYKLDKFVEKPELALAKKYTASGKYYWNANQYVWRADSFLKALAKHAPEIAVGIDKIIAAIGTSGLDKVIKEEYEKMPKISVDYAVSEKANNFLMLVANYKHWTDIGDWNEVWKNLPKDELGNVIIDGEEEGGDIINIDTSDALIHKNGRMIAIIDVDNIVVVDTKDALLVCSKSRAQNVKQIVQKLKEEKKEQYL